MTQLQMVLSFKECVSGLKCHDFLGHSYWYHFLGIELSSIINVLALEMSLRFKLCVKNFL